MNALDVIIPVYNEGDNAVRTLRSLEAHVKTPFAVAICHDDVDDGTLAVLSPLKFDFPVRFVQNGVRRGPHGAVLSGFRQTSARAVLVWPADDDYNAPIIDSMVDAISEGADIVCASRFMRGGTMQGCPWLKSIMVRTAAFVLHRFARLPTHDATNGLRMFSRALLDEVPIESTEGFTYSIELLVKAHRMGKRIVEVPASWFERKEGKSRFRPLRWSGPYLRWVQYAFVTRFFC